jgi:birA, biotin-[acetyl-CoA-carboxylase] ligase region
VRDIFLKWPNDIIINDSKCAGILIESLRSNNNKEYLAIGIGVNLIKYPLNSSFKATSLKEEFNFDVDRDEFLNKLNINLLENIKRWEKGKNFSQILKDWKKFAYKINESISMLLPTGKKIEGIFSDLNDQGGLILSHNKETSVFYAAEIIEELKIV